MDYITKIEGHARLVVKTEGTEVKKAQLEVFEGSRFFEALVKGRKAVEAPNVTSRICGICSVAHAVTSLKAVENAYGIEPSRQTEELRKLMVLAQVVYSHALHLYVMVLPDYFGFTSAFSMAKKHPTEVKRGLRLAMLGDKVITEIGGREPHPVTSIVGGFSKIPTKATVASLLHEAKEFIPDALATAELFASWDYPQLERESEYLALHHDGKYAFMGGEICSTKKRVCQFDYLSLLKEYTSPYSTSKFVTLEGKAYMVGSLARLNLGHDTLSDNAKRVLRDSGVRVPSHNPFVNNFAQAVEMVHAFDRLVSTLEELQETGVKDEAPKKIPSLKKPSRGVSALEAPRGTLFHDYTVGRDGLVEAANIITPTAQNLRRMEEDIRAFLPSLLEQDLPRDKIVLGLEQLIRAYDPCISCAAHFLEVKGI